MPLPSSSSPILPLPMRETIRTPTGNAPDTPSPRNGTGSRVLVLVVAILAAVATAILTAPALDDLWQAVRAAFGRS
jgi:hypothetical protein